MFLNDHKSASDVLEPHLSDFPPGTALTMSDIENFHLARNDFDACTRNTFKNLLEDGEVFADVTLACAEKQLKAHKVFEACCPITGAEQSDQS